MFYSISITNLDIPWSRFLLLSLYLYLILFHLILIISPMHICPILSIYIFLNLSVYLSFNFKYTITCSISFPIFLYYCSALLPSLIHLSYYIYVFSYLFPFPLFLFSLPLPFLSSFSRFFPLYISLFASVCFVFE